MLPSIPAGESWVIHQDSPYPNLDEESRDWALRLAQMPVREFLAIDSPAMARITEAGFTFGRPRVRPLHHGVSLIFPFTCVCGKREALSVIWNPELLNHCPQAVLPFDVARELERNGAVSAKHLREDGYSEQGIARIRKPYERVEGAHA